MRTIGILGGMGPQATLELYRRIIEISVRRYGARRNQDYPHLLISNLPAPDLINDARQLDEVTEQLVTESRALAAAGAEVQALACNTLHLCLPRLAAASDARFLSMVEESIERAAQLRPRTVGLLGSRTTVESGLYAEPLAARGIAVVTPTPAEQRKVVGMIRRVLSGRRRRDDPRTLLRIAKGLRRRGADVVILGCTELPLLVQTPRPWLVDSVQVLAESVCRAAFERDFTQAA